MSFPRLKPLSILGALALLGACTEEQLEAFQALLDSPRMVYAQEGLHEGRPSVVLRSATFTPEDQLLVWRSTRLIPEGASESAQIRANPAGDLHMVQFIEPFGGGLDVWWHVVDRELATSLQVSDDIAAGDAARVCDATAIAQSIPDIAALLAAEVAEGTISDAATAQVNIGRGSAPIGQGFTWADAQTVVLGFSADMSITVTDPVEGVFEDFLFALFDVSIGVIYQLQDGAFEPVGCDLDGGPPAPVPAAVREVGINDAGYVTLEGARAEAALPGMDDFIGPGVSALSGPFALP